MKEAQFKSKFKDDFKEYMLEKHNLEVVILPMKQGIRSTPDDILLCGDKWALLEWKRHKDADKQANQDYWVDHYNEMSYASFIFPDNAKEVWRDLEELFTSS